MSNNYGENTDINTASSTASNDGDYTSVTPTTVESNEDLQNELNGQPADTQDGRTLDLDANTWGGMESGAGYWESTQDSNWLNTVPLEHRSQASAWNNQQGMLKIIPKAQRQKFTYSTLAYIAETQQEPKVQVFPISDVNVVPHQITFDFYDTTEGRVGVSNAVEKHMQVECDVYLTDLIYEYWNHGGDGQNDFSRMNWSNAIKTQFWNAVTSHNDYNYLLSTLIDIESTKEFADFRNTFLQQHSGWVCLFSSHTFGIFQGVLTDVSYSITSGETFAKWHLKFEEAIFLEDAYSQTGQKPTAESTASSDGSQDNSGDATNSE